MLISVAGRAGSVLGACEELAAPWLKPILCWAGSLAACSRYVGRPRRLCVSSRPGDGTLVLFRETIAHPSGCIACVCGTRGSFGSWALLLTVLMLSACV